MNHASHSIRSFTPDNSGWTVTFQRGDKQWTADTPSTPTRTPAP